MSQTTLSDRPYLNSNLFSSHYLDERVRERNEWDCDEAARETMGKLRSLYENEQDLVEGYKEDPLIQNWIDEVLDILGFGTQVEPTLPEGGGYVDVLLFENNESRRNAAQISMSTGDTTDLFAGGIGLVEAKQWDADFTERFHEQRPYRNASHQVKHYLERTPENIQWGLLTNGRKWRLYGTKDYETQTYYEVDLPELLEHGDLEAFKYFYVFFRPDAFRKPGGETFLDTVWSESETASQELGEDLQNNVFTALRVLGRGFVETNDLRVDPEDDDALNELKDQSLVLLYRLMFVLYAEARGLIHPEGQQAQDEYEDNFSLDALRLRIHDAVGEVDEGFDDEFSENSTTMWSQLEDLFRLIDEGNASLGIPPYNGGLFDREKHAFLTDHRVSNRYLAEVIYRLSTTRNDEGRYVLADYGDLDTRHLGSVYEGLLEHQFRVAPEEYAAVAAGGSQVWKSARDVTVADAVETVPEGGLYVVNDEDERKAAGAYYTPDYVVTYIVEETVGPLIEEIREDLVEQGFERGTQEYLGPFLRRVTDLKILDPAMGSGHFLTKATGYLAEEVMREVREIEVELGFDWDEQYVRREIAKECIYGVDLNGMAVELAKLSMWLETLSADRPLAFLDHHFKTGNSLVGSDIEAIEGLESDAKTNGDNEQSSLATFGATREGTIERLMDIYQEFLAIENEDIADVKRMERKYAEIREDDLRKRLVAMADVRTAEDFGLDVSTEGDRNPYEWMASALESGTEWERVEERDWFRSAQAMAEEQDFFHWKLEFPEVFYETGGKTASDAGFDGIVGNPPYVFIDSIPEQHRTYYRAAYQSWDYRYDLYGVFVEKATDTLTDGGQFGYIIPHSMLNNSSFGILREQILSRTSDIRLIDFSGSVFADASNEPMILLFQAGGGQGSASVLRSALISPEELGNVDRYLAEYSASAVESLPEQPFIVRGGEWVGRTLGHEDAIPLGEHVDAVQGLRTGNNTERLSKEKAAEDHRKALRGEDIYRYGYEWSGTYVLYDRDLLSSDPAARPREEKFWETDVKILVQEIRNVHLRRRIVATIDNKNHIGLNTTNALILKDDPDYSIHYLMGVLSSRLMNELFVCCFVDNHIATQYIEALPLYAPDIEGDRTPDRERLAELFDPIINGVEEFDGVSETAGGYHGTAERLEHDGIAYLSNQITDLSAGIDEINLHLPDYLTNYDDGPTLAALASPPAGISATLLTKTTTDTDRYEKLRISGVRIDREGDDCTVSIVPYAKPVESVREEYETNSHGYATLDPVPAMELRGLDTAQADLIESFVPYAVSEADGFAGFRDNATKTITPLDRLEALTLPALDDVRNGLADYRDAVKRAEELDEKIERTDALIDEIVYELYGLTDEEIEIVEEAIGD